jgi:hypothetical protein
MRIIKVLFLVIILLFLFKGLSFASLSFSRVDGAGVRISYENVSDLKDPCPQDPTYWSIAVTSSNGETNGSIEATTLDVSALQSFNLGFSVGTNISKIEAQINKSNEPATYENACKILIAQGDPLFTVEENTNSDPGQTPTPTISTITPTPTPVVVYINNNTQTIIYSANTPTPTPKTKKKVLISPTEAEEKPLESVLGAYTEGKKISIPSSKEVKVLSVNNFQRLNILFIPLVILLLILNFLFVYLLTKRS